VTGAWLGEASQTEPVAQERSGKRGLGSLLGNMFGGAARGE
jgi:hypothetical protein